MGTKPTPEQEAGLETVRAFVEATRSEYRLPPIHIMVGDHITGVGASHRPGQLAINPRLLTSQYRDAIVAHELGHAALGHDQRETSFDRMLTRADWEARQHKRELDANAKSVEILVRVKGWPESTALRHVSDWLTTGHRAEQAGRLVMAPGHPRPCAELADLWSRYPQHARPPGLPTC